MFRSARVATPARSSAPTRAFPSTRATASRPIQSRAYSTEKAPLRVSVTGASGQIGYALLFRIASGQMLGEDQPVILNLLELPSGVKALEGVAMELNDCAFPLLRGIVQTTDPKKAFEGADYALLVGAKPRTKGMERGDLLSQNAAIFSAQGKALNETANKSVKVLVVGNPANTNALIASANAPTINPRNFSAMTRLDHNRGLAQLALEIEEDDVSLFEKFAIWGNHSATQYPDVNFALYDGEAVKPMLEDEWIRDTFIPTVQKRGAAIIEARGASSAASAASAAIDHMRDWTFGTDGQWTSMAVPSEGLYGESKGLFFSYPVTIDEKGEYSIVKGLQLDEFSKLKISETNKELLAERDGVKSQLP